MPAPDPTLDRLVVILCGPPGAGKTTHARRSGLDVHDRDQWADDRRFADTIAQLADQPDARAVVIVPAPSTAERHQACRLTEATHCYLVTAAPHELYRRIASRPRTTRVQALAAIGSWFDHYDDCDAVQTFPGWDHLGPPNTYEAREATWTW